MHDFLCIKSIVFPIMNVINRNWTMSCIMSGTLLPGVLDCVKRCSISKRIKVLYNHCHLHHGNIPQPPWQGMKFSIGSSLIQF